MPLGMLKVWSQPLDMLALLRAKVIKIMRYRACASALQATMR